MKYVYVRNSLGDAQSLDKQKQIIGDVGDAVIIEDTDKRRLKDLLENKIKAGDTIYISDLNRITRKVEEAINLHNYLSQKGVVLYIKAEKFELPSTEIIDAFR